MSEKTLGQSIDTVWTSGKRYDFTEIKMLIHAELSGYKDRRDPTHRGNQHIAKMLMLLGEAGIGKTSFWKQLAIEFQVPMRMINFGEVEVEDNLGIPKAAEGTLYHEVQAPPGFPLEVPETDKTGQFDVLPGRDLTGSSFIGKGIVLFNEVCTVNPKQESQLRSAISERKIGYNRIADGWLLVADSNPADTKYTTVNKLDHSLESRIFPLPVSVSFRDSMNYWRETGALGDRLFGFLLMNKQATWEYADNRRWTSTADTVQCMLAANASASSIGKFLSLAIDPTVGTGFEAYMKFGDDPIHYPIPVNALLSASKTDHTAQMKLCQAWTKDPERQALLSATAFDLREFLHSSSKIPTKSQLANIAGFFEYLNSSQVAEIVTDATPETAAQLRGIIRGTKHDRNILDMHRKDADQRYNSK